MGSQLVSGTGGFVGRGESLPEIITSPSDEPGLLTQICAALASPAIYRAASPSTTWSLYKGPKPSSTSERN